MVRKIQINMSNKSFYSLAVIGVLVLFGIGVYAYGSSNPAIHGHSIDELAPPAGCVGGQVLGWSGNSWQCVDAGSSIAIEEGCPEGYESFTNQLGESCILKDDWSDSGSISGDKYSGSAETRMHNGKRQVRITGCSYYGSCTSDWADNIASCKTYIHDVYQYGCMAVVADRYKVNLWVGNLYFDQRNILGEGSFGPGTVDTIVKYYPPYNGAGVGVDVPKGEHKGSCKVSQEGRSGWDINLWSCTSAKWPGKCGTDNKGCECESGYRMVERKDLLPSWRSHHYECVKN